MKYEIVIATPYGQELATLTTFGRLHVTRAVNAPGRLQLTMPATIPLDYLGRDTIITVYRDKQLLTGTAWLLRRVQRTLTESGTRAITIYAVSGLDLVRRRIVAYNAGSSFASKTGTADGLISTIVSQNMGSTVNLGFRDLESGGNGSVDLSAYLTIRPAAAGGVTLSKGFARRNVLTVCQELAAASAEQGVYVAFDVGYVDGHFDFATYLNTRGQDRRMTSTTRSASPLLFSPQNGTITELAITYDYEDEATVVIAGGQGTDEAREIAIAVAATRRDASPFGRIERFVQANNISDPTSLAAEAYAELRASRPRTRIEARLRSGPQAQYGVDWDFGDYVTIQDDDVVFDARLDALDIEVADGVETIGGLIRI